MNRDNLVIYSAIVLFGGLILFAAIWSFFISDNPGGVPFNPVRKAGCYYFIDNFRQATVSVNNQNVPVVTVMKIKDRKLKSIFAHPTSLIEYKNLVIKEGAVLFTAIGISPEAWDKGGDGVRFLVSLKVDNSPLMPLFVDYLKPDEKEDDRQWRDVKIELPVSGKNVSIVFETEPGPFNNNSYDWAYWGDPYLEIPH